VVGGSGWLGAARYEAILSTSHCYTMTEQQPSPQQLPHILPYSMCSKQECDDRVKFGEVSRFEETDESYFSSSGNIKSRKIDPQRAVSKYRRSAAGMSDDRKYPQRSFEQIASTVDYLLHVLACRGARSSRPPPPSIWTTETTTTTTKDSDDPQQPQRESLQTTIAFVEDRIRAVQVDLVKLQDPRQHSLQRKLARCQILILYLTADCKDGSESRSGSGGGSGSWRYERKFGTSALNTALSSYWYFHPRGATTNNHHNQHDDDEMLSLASLVQLNRHLQQALSSAAGYRSTAADNSSSLASTVLGLYRRHIVHNPSEEVESSPSQRQRQPQPPKLHLLVFQWTLELVVAATLGHWHVVIGKLLTRSDSDVGVRKGDDQQRSAPVPDPDFLVLARCCLAPSLPFIRWKALESYNFSFGKGEAVSGLDIARLLGYYNNYRCRNSNNASISTEDENEDKGESPPPQPSAAIKSALRFGHEAAGLPLNEAKDCLLFKVAPLRELLFSSPSSSSKTTVSALSSLRDDDFVFGGPDAAVDDDVEFDSDGIAIPSPDRIRKLLLLS